MSLFDSMMLNNGGKQHKQSGMKKTANSSGIPENEAYKEEFSEEFSVKKRPSDEPYSGLKPVSSKKVNKIEKNSSSFKEEFSEGLVNDTSHFGMQTYSKAGVTFEKLSESQAKINYSGLLAKSGAQDITAVYGFGSNQKWENVSEMHFKREQDGTFTAILPVEQGKNINVAFKDPADNWDNNSGMNYTFVN